MILYDTMYDIFTYTPHLQNVHYMNISTLVSTTRFSSITVFIHNLKKLISLYHRGITVPVHIRQTLMSVHNTTMIQCNHNILTITIYLFNINVPLTDYISHYVHLTVHVNSVALVSLSLLRVVVLINSRSRGPYTV